MRSKNNRQKLLIALFAGIVVSLIVFSSINGLNQKLQEQQNTITTLQSKATTNNTNNNQPQLNNQVKSVAVAKSQIKSGTILTADLIEINEISQKDIPPESYSEASILVGKQVMKDLKVGEIITKSKLLDQAVITIPKGYRAITIAAKNIDGLSSDVSVGSSVDLLMSKKLKPENDSKNDTFSTMIISENVKIVSISNNRDTFTFLVPFKKTSIVYQALASAGNYV